MLATGRSSVLTRRLAMVAWLGGAMWTVGAAARQEPLPGWQMVAASGDEQWRGHAAAASFALGQGESLSPVVPALGLIAGYTAQVAIDSAGRYRFGTLVQGGSARIQVFTTGGQKLDEAMNAGAAGPLFTGWLNLKAAPVTVSVLFTRAGEAPARLRTLWQKDGTGEQGFAAEAVPPSAAGVPGFALREARAADSARRGRVLLGELNCVACHNPGERGRRVIVERAAPSLQGIADQTEPAFLAAWVRDPQSIKPGCGMPGVFGDSDRDRSDAGDITQFLLSLKDPHAPVPMASHGSEEGRRLFHTIGCVACHGAIESPAGVFKGVAGVSDEVPAAAPPHPFGKLAGKWRPAGLAAFVRDPLSTHPGGRMPAMNTTEGEAWAIAAYLIEAWGPGEKGGPVPEPARVSAGRTAFATRGCASCHSTIEGVRIESAVKSRTIDQIDTGKGCMGPGTGAWPRYTLSEQNRADLSAGIEMVRRANAAKRTAPSPIDRAELAIAALGCANCHHRNEAGGLADAYKPYFQTVDGTELGDEGRFAPTLTGVGFKLRTPWLTRVLTAAGRARPYMSMRMPQFGHEQVGDLAAALAAMDGITPDSDAPAPQISDELMLAGRRLVGESGMNCISCHTFASRNAGTAGPEMRDMVERIRYEWFGGYILAPQRFKPGTRMSSFYKDGRGTVVDVLGGDPGAQTRALWTYLGAARMAPSPEGLPSGQGMPVAIGDRPVVFRTFMKDAGNRGIAVGYPIGIHFGFDATAVRLVDAWRGEFIDATSVWKNRGGEVVSGQGKAVWSAPAGPALVIGARPEVWPDSGGAEGVRRFKGYSIEPDGTPTFHYEIQAGEGAAQVSERFGPGSRGGQQIRREFKILGLRAGVTVWMNAGKNAAEIGAARGGKADAVKRPDGETWYGVAADGGELSFRVEITP